MAPVIPLPFVFTIMNHRDYACASGQLPPEVGLCSVCKLRTEVDEISINGRIIQMCKKCQRDLENKPEDEDLGDLPL